jgi:hypothetical protein
MALCSLASFASVPFCGTKLQHRIIAYVVKVTFHCMMLWFSVWFTAGAVVADFIAIALNSHFIILGITNIFKMKYTLQLMYEKDSPRITASGSYKCWYK